MMTGATGDMLGLVVFCIASVVRPHKTYAKAFSASLMMLLVVSGHYILHSFTFKVNRRMVSKVEPFVNQPQQRRV